MANVETGNGATTTFTGGFTAVPYTITIDEQTLPSVADSTLANTTNESSTPGDLGVPGGFTATVVAATTAALPTKGSVVTGTITYSVPSGSSSGATYAGTGYIDSVTPPSATNNERLEHTFHFMFDGKTGPTWTIAS